VEQERENDKEILPVEKSAFFSSTFIRFLGGKNLLFLLIVTLLLGCIILIFNKISFVFKPLQVLMEVVILPGVLGIILYYLLRPFTRLFDHWKIPRFWGIVIIYLVLIGFITLAIVLIFPLLREQFTNLLQEFPEYILSLVEDIVSYLNNSSFNEFFEKYGLDYNRVVNDLSNSFIETVKDTVTTVASSVASGVTSFITRLTGILLSLVIVPFILFYLLYEGEKMPKFIIRIFPPRLRPGISAVLTDMDKQISSYIQGQILVSICIGTMVTIGFLIIDLDYAILLGILAMFTSVVPYLGPLIAITPALIISLVTGGFSMFFMVGVVWTIVQLVEGKFISPQIMGKSLKVHPITIIFVLLTSGALFGVPGVILGIPGYAMIKVFVQHGFRYYQKRFNRFQNSEEDQYTVKQVGSK
jgi:predicted PurR-regulated permease PerM